MSNNPLHPSLPPIPSLPLPPKSSSYLDRSPGIRPVDSFHSDRPPPRSREDEYPRPIGGGPTDGFSREGFAPIRSRHADYERERERDADFDRQGGPPPREYREREFPRRELDPEGERERWERAEFDRPKRHRSPSPPTRPIKARHFSPSPPPHRPPPQFHNPSLPPDPASIDTLLTFRAFADWFRSSHPQTAKADEEELRKVRMAIEDGTATEDLTKERVGMGKRYERYRKEYSSRQLYALFLTHQSSAWFIERYSPEPEFVSLRRRVNRQGRVRSVEKYLEGLRNGEFDSVVFEQSVDHDKPRRSSRTGAEEPEGLDRALGDRSDRYEGGEGGGRLALDDELRVEVKPFERQIFVKTVPPQTKRKDLEALFAQVDGFQYLALSEPSAKKSFHRVGWAQFGEGVDVSDVVQRLDGQKIENFTFHMGINLSSTIGRVRITPHVANTLERLLTDGEQARRLALKLEDELVGETALETEAATERVEDNKETNGMGKSVEERGLLERGSTAVEEAIERLLLDQGLEDAEGLDDSLKTRRAKLILDQWMNYLREGLSTCYYCVAPLSFPEELHRKCIAHVRPPATSILSLDEAKIEEDKLEEAAEDEEVAHEEKMDEGDRDGDGDREKRENDDPASTAGQVSQIQGASKKIFPQKSTDEKWMESLDFRLKPLLEDDVDVVEYGGRDPEEETRKLCAPLIKQEEPSKYRCKDCSKLFRAPEFVIKHVQVKHPEMVKPKIDEISILNNFVLDPQHTPTTATTPAAVNDAIVVPQQTQLLQFGAVPNGNPGNQFNGMFNPAFSNPLVGGNGTNQPGMPFNPLMIQHQATMMMMQMQQAMMMAAANGGGVVNGGAGSLVGRVGDFAGDNGVSAAPLPAPPPGGEDPRARKGRVSYKDLDEVGGGGDGGLPY